MKKPRNRSTQITLILYTAIFIKIVTYIRNNYLVLVSLICTPLIIFISTSTELYLKNQRDLGFDFSILTPFLALFFIVLIIGYSIFLLSKSYQPFRVFLWVYYLLGPFYLLFPFIRSLPLESSVKFSGSLLLFLTALIILSRRTNPSQMIQFFAFFAVALLTIESFLFVKNLELPGSISTDKIQVANSAKPDNKLPNIYHIIFDEYQTEMFESTLTEDVRDKLGGFTFFPNNITVYGRTGMSLATIFTGKFYNYNEPQIDYQKNAFDSDQSIIYWLKESGYTTYAYSPKIYTFDQPLFDHLIFHTRSIETNRSMNNLNDFVNLWIYSYTPRTIAKKVIPSEKVGQIEGQNLLPTSAPSTSYSSFVNIIKKEYELSNSNRYTFIHLLIPHFPYVLDSECNYTEGQKTSPTDQSKCATNMILDFIKTLKQLNFFEDSLILIHSDHGARFVKEKGVLAKIDRRKKGSDEWNMARARSLLLVKPVGAKSSDPFLVSNAESILPDLAPTILESVGIKTSLNFDGISLTDPTHFPAKRQRYYHFFDKKGENEWTDELTRFIIEDGKIRLDRVIELRNNGRPEN